MGRNDQLEPRQIDLQQYRRIVRAVDSLLGDAARRSAMHAERVIVSSNEHDEAIRLAYLEATEHLKRANDVLTPIGDVLGKLQPPPEPPPNIFARFFFFVIRHDWQDQRALPA